MRDLHDHGVRLALSGLAAALLLTSVSVVAQPARGTDGATSDALGQRKTTVVGILDPTARVQGRIANRVRSRIDTRLSRDLTPAIGLNAASKYATASNQARNAETQRRRR